MENYSTYLFLGLILAIYILYKILGNRKVKQALNNGAVVIDVRSPQEFDTGHFPNSKNIPLQSIGKEIKSLRNLNKDIIVVCASGMRSEKAKNLLVREGITCHNGGSWRYL